MKHVYFYEPEFYMLSNFSSFAVDWKGSRWMTAEHVYQSEKFEDEKIKREIFEAPSAHAAKEISKANRDKKREGWSDVKVDVMREVLRAKLSQHKVIQEKLAESGERELVENSPFDDFWGSGENGNGENMLGRLWIELRENQ